MSVCFSAFSIVNCELLTDLLCTTPDRSAALQTMPRGRYYQLKRMQLLLNNQSEDCLFLNIYVPSEGNHSSSPHIQAYYHRHHQRSTIPRSTLHPTSRLPVTWLSHPAIRSRIAIFNRMYLIALSLIEFPVGWKSCFFFVFFFLLFCVCVRLVAVATNSAIR